VVFLTLLPEAINDLSELFRVEELVEDVFKGGGVFEGPEGFILMAEYNFVEDGLRGAKQNGDLLLDLGALVVDLDELVVLISGLQDLLQRFELLALVTNTK
jgi:hypothetical protein